MGLLLDSHTLLWYIGADSQLSKRAQTKINATALVYVSVATLWELSIKHALGKLSLYRAPHEFFPSQLAENGFSLLGISELHIYRAAALPQVDGHKDPFDRMLVGQALVEDLQLVSADVRLDAYGISRLW